MKTTFPQIKNISSLHIITTTLQHPLHQSVSLKMSEKVAAIQHSEVQEPNGNFDRTWRDEKWDGKALQEEAAEVFIDEKELGPMEALKAYPMAVVWSLVMATCVIMEGYDTNLLGNFFAYRKYNNFCSLGTILI